jgi:alkylation response protein AidB-like acyl-CoA dehydrogenase
MLLNEEQTLLADSASEFLQQHCNNEQLRALRDADDPLGYHPDSWQQMLDLGWAGIVIPEAYGGVDFGYLGMGVVMEHSGRNLTASPLFASAGLCASILLHAADEAQKQALLPGIVSGEVRMALAMEEGSRHGVPGKMRAEAAGDGFVLTGSKTFGVDGMLADKLLVLARSEGVPGDHEGLSLFLVDAEALGIKRTRQRLMDSRNYAQIEFDNVRVGGDALIGVLHQASVVLEPAIDKATALLAAEMLGGIQYCFDKTLDYLKEREQFDAKIGSFQALKHRASKMFIEIELLRASVMAALAAIDNGSDDVARLASLVKARANDTAALVSNEAVQLHGGIGVTDELDIGLYLKRARVQMQLLGDAAFHRDRFASLSGY